MKNYVISYDLHNRRNYTDLYKLLSAWKAQKLTESQWLVSLNCSAMAALNFVVPTVDGDDTVTVIEIPRGSDWATSRGPIAANAWLSNNVTPRQIAA